MPLKPRLLMHRRAYAVSVGAAVGVLVAALAAAQDAVQPLMRIYFIPFAVETHAPVTKEDIEKAGFYRIILGRPSQISPRAPDHPLVTKLPAVLRAHPSARKLDELVIRLKVEGGGATYYVDKEGTVLESTSGRTFQLTRDEMQRLHKDIVGLRGVVDVDVCSRLPCPSASGR